MRHPSFFFLLIIITLTSVAGCKKSAKAPDNSKRIDSLVGVYQGEIYHIYRGYLAPGVYYRDTTYPATVIVEKAQGDSIKIYGGAFKYSSSNLYYVSVKYHNGNYVKYTCYPMLDNMSYEQQEETPGATVITSEKRTFTGKKI